MELLDNDAFLARLASLFESTKEQGTIWLTHKRFTYEDGDVAMKSEDGSDDTREYPCLLRATDGKKNAFSTRINSGQLPVFHAAYSSLLKASMSTLKKRDKKREKLRSEQTARRRKLMSDPAVIDGPKRGNGRKKRQRQVKLALKQQKSQQKFKEREAKVKVESAAT
ncbi:signal recognition particle, SRP9/SRP14 subunit [Infundibulicybe gibba]|nr:signal recognition particle, SRP9/SRP14 subunit [Infundibulicybe gibba]